MLKTIGKLMLGVAGAVVMAAAALFIKGTVQLAKVRDLPAPALAVRTDSAAVARGRHFATAIFKCVDCHGPDLGGREPFVDAGPLGVVNTANLTTGQGGIIGRYNDAALARTIRHGIRADGSPIPIMPALAYITASDEDLAAVIAYVRSVPAVDREHQSSTVRPLGRILYAAGQFPIVDADLIDHATAPVRVPAGATVEYGKYLASVGGCIGCHGPGLSGGKIPGGAPDWKPAANITTAGIKGWTEADFITALKTGQRPNRTPIDTVMPWRLAGQMDSTEMHAVWLFLQSMPARPFGGR